MGIHCKCRNPFVNQVVPFGKSEEESKMTKRRNPFVNQVVPF